MALRETPSQTAGPYVHIGCTPHVTGITNIYDEDLGKSPIRDGAQGQIITINGAIFDGDGTPLTDAMLETWQADASGRIPGRPNADPDVTGWARIAADGEDGTFTLKTVKPGATSQVPHIAVWLVARGISIGLQTRIYFGDEDNSADPVLSQIDPDRRSTLITTVTAPNTHRFDIHLQGDAETVFLDI